ncbi:caspase family protein [Streptomyces sp. NPDC002889]|uniref:caspase, EACC1-associated type n=1 Tax=Streptomyces sp. NPDC002889 TaxID=3364669 RepID=UPI00369492FB
MAGFPAQPAQETTDEPEPPARDRSRALLIGVSTYDDEHLESVPTAVRDAEALGHALTHEESGVFDAEHVQLLLDAERREIEDALNAAAASSEDLLLIYYSGHGLVPAESKLRLCAKDTRKSSPWATALDVESLLTLVERYPRIRRMVVILDCCYSGNVVFAKVADERWYAVTASQRQWSVPNPDGGEYLSYFTAALVDVLRQGVEGKGPVTLRDVYEELDRRSCRWPVRKDTERWGPEQRGDRNVLTTVLSRSRGPEDPPEEPEEKENSGRARRKALVAAVVLAAVGAAPFGVHAIVKEPTSCPTPLEMRVLTTPELRSAVVSMAATHDAARTGPLNDDDDFPRDCRRIHTTVYAAPSEQAISALIKPSSWADPTQIGNDHGTAAPVQTIGPQPDIWIPDSTSDVMRARPHLKDQNVIRLSKTTRPIAFSPLVLGVPTGLLPDSLEQKQSSWNELLDELSRKSPGVRLLRPTPVFSNIGTLHTAGLHHRPDGNDVRTFEGNTEERLSTPDGQSDSNEVLCQAQGRAAVLVSEHDLQQYNRDRQVDQCETATQWLEFTQYSPRGVPALDHPFVPVTWLAMPKEQRELRGVAAEGFRRHLVGAEGQRTLWEDGYRPADSKGDPADPPPSTDSPLEAVRNSPVERRPFTAQQIERALEEYREASAAGRVLILFDASGSMGDGERYQGAVAAVGEVLRALPNQEDGRDGFRIRTFAQSPVKGEPPAYTDIGDVPYWSDPADAKELDKRLEQLSDSAERTIKRNYCAMRYEALAAAAATLQDKQHRKGNQVVLLVTDGDDRGKSNCKGVAEKDAKSATENALQKVDVPVLTISLTPLGCTEEERDGLGGTGGACVGIGDHAGLADLLAGGIPGGGL